MSETKKKGTKRKQPDIGMTAETLQFTTQTVEKKVKKRKTTKTKEDNVFTAGNLQPFYQSKTCVYQPFQLVRRIVQQYSKVPTVWIGLDMSLSSPAATVIDVQTKTFHCYFLWDRAKPLNMNELKWTEGPWSGWKWEMHPIEATFNDNATEIKEAGQTHGIYRYRRIDDRLMWVQVILEEWRHRYPAAEIRVGIEHYSFGSSSTQFASAAITNMALTELGGCIRWWLCKQERVQCLEIPPMGIKRTFSSSGKADKKDMYQAYLLRHNGPALDSVFPFTKPIAEYGKEPPHPISDMIDSLAATFAVAHCCTLH